MAKKTGAKKRRAENARVENLAEEIRFDEAAADLAERQNLGASGGEVLRRRLEAHNFSTPELSGDDIDADWHLSLEGSENVAGHVPTPDQDQVDELGAAAGLTYADDEPLDYGKVAARDQHRWELNPASAEREEAAERDEADVEYMTIELPKPDRDDDPAAGDVPESER